jgi:hypothetical protein
MVSFTFSQNVRERISDIHKKTRSEATCKSFSRIIIYKTRDKIYCTEETERGGGGGGLKRIKRVRKKTEMGMGAVG